jgi:hypothetical protein
MPGEIYTNDASTTVTTGGTGTPGTETWTVASSASFPAASNTALLPVQFHVADPALPSELMTVTNVSGTSWSVTRGAEGTTAVAHTAGFTVRQVVSANALLQLRDRLDWANAVTLFGADPTGGADSTGAIQAALCSFGTLGTGADYVQGTGGVVYLPAGYYAISNTLIVPSGVTLRGAGMFATILHMSNTVAADMVQTSTYNSSAQATILGATIPARGYTAANLTNSFFCGFEDFCLHGNAFGTTIVAYNHGINVTTNPTITAAPTDTQFDTTHWIRNVYLEAMTGDGFYHNGRANMSLLHVIALSNAGNGFTPSFDTNFTACFAGFNGCCGFYFDHGSVTGVGCKTYNNGQGEAWVSGTAYNPGTSVIYSNALYFCILAVSGSTVPSSDATHWTLVSQATSPQAWGRGFYWDNNCIEHGWAGCDSQEDTNDSYYLNGCNTIAVQGTSYEPNFGSVTNPNDIASVVFSGASGCTVTISVSYMAVTSAYAMRVVSGSTGNNMTITSDGTELAHLSPDSVIVAGNTLLYNGVSLVARVDASAALTDAATIAVNAALSNTFTVTLGGSRTLGSPTQAVDGQKVIFEITQPASGGPYTLSYGSAYEFTASLPSPTLSTAASAMDMLGFIYSAAKSKWLLVAFAAGY